MKLSDLVRSVDHTLLSGTEDREITGLCRDNRKASPGDLFICTKGARFDTHDPAVVRGLFEKGITSFVAEQPLDVPEADVLIVPDTRKAGALIYSAWYGHPENEMTMIGITGSKGKTTTAHMIRKLLEASGQTVGLIGTNGAEYPGCVEELANTTPDYDELEYHLRAMADRKVRYCVLEVSSQAVLMERVDHIDFKVAVWLNLQEGDHIGPNEHESFRNYMECKARLLSQATKRLVNTDDPYSYKTIDLAKRAAVKRQVSGGFETFGTFGHETYTASDIRPYYDETEKRPGVLFHMKGICVDDDILVGFPGEWHVYNAMAAVAVARSFGVPKEIFTKALFNVPIRGREELVYRGDFTVCVDFAHNGASAMAHLKGVHEYRPKRVICVFGADGNRSKGRRYGMGEAAGRYADLAIITSGHNRFETFEAILEDTLVGINRAEHPNYIAIKDREEAIRYAIDHAEPGDFITILGLGHEHWQEENGIKRVYNDGDFVRSVLMEKGLLQRGNDHE
ncbi:MAG: UDP-N-acetylmuramoyl-L-alanyl-D-glutamate--2,6-diaminopimelate ligase [Lachnospiraceae bacterium]|nr:UDP-N-acetylmuramoyl-L-alanyl-D-glutamate--2,6-diaminopimelate ligase [Lachnospiraceae bacterium]